jgi:hypothetical protein
MAVVGGGVFLILQQKFPSFWIAFVSFYIGPFLLRFPPRVATVKPDPTKLAWRFRLSIPETTAPTNNFKNHPDECPHRN